MNDQQIARELTAVVRELSAAELWQKVARQFGEKLALKVHTRMLTQGIKYANDERLNPNDLPMSEFMREMLGGLQDKARDIQQKNYR